jgi:uncharacterized protein (UPF0548 family)
MAERTNALVLKTRGGETPVGSNPTAPAAGIAAFRQMLKVLKIIKIMETFAFGFCTLWVLFSSGEEQQEIRMLE